MRLYITAIALAISLPSASQIVRIDIQSSGVYRIPYSKLHSLGFSNPENVSILGNGGAMLPLMNAESIPAGNGICPVMHSNNSIYFFAQGVDSWSYSEDYNMWTCSRNIFSERGSYFITADNHGVGMENATKNPAQDGQSITEGTFVYQHEENRENLLGSGRKWYGEHFFYSSSNKIDFQCYNAPKSLRAQVSMIARSASSESFSVNQSAPVSFSPVGNSGLYADTKTITLDIPPQNSANQQIEIQFQKHAASVEAYLDYVSLNTTEPLIYKGKTMIFRRMESSGNNGTSRIEIQNPGNRHLIILDVTNPAKTSIVAKGQNSFGAEISTQNVFAVFDPDNVDEPKYVTDFAGKGSLGKLRGINTPELLIVTPERLLPYALQIKEIHKDLETAAVSVESIYNDFSSGICDIAAIRDFVRFLYKKEEGKLKYLLLLGDGSVCNHIDKKGNPNLLPTYQSPYSLNEEGTGSFVTDDFFGLLDDDEGEYFGDLDIGIGRLPAKNESEAQILVNKIKSYTSNTYNREWKKNIVFVADDEDNNIHNYQADYMAENLEKNHAQYDIRKIYLDQYQQQNSAAGSTYPGAKSEILQSIDRGASIINYVGHGGMRFFSDERVLTISDIDELKNGERLPIFITASCDIGRFDHYDLSKDESKDSPAERLLLNKNGGAVALFTTSRTVLSNENFNLNKNIYKYILDPICEGHPNRLGDVIKNAKRETADKNMLNFILLGDPALQLEYPKLSIEITKVNGEDFNNFSDTLKALGTYEIECRISGGSDLGGTAFVTLWDKRSTESTLNNDGHGPFEYQNYRTKIFSGQSTVSNGVFKFKFLIPKDIDYNVGESKLSLFANSQNITASDFSKKLLVGGTFPNAENDQTGPEIKLYINNLNFQDGDKIETRNPMLIAQIADSSGINITGMGHNIVATIDNALPEINLNNYYKADKDSHTSGQIEYQIGELKEGAHTLKLKAWDNYNNSSTAEISFAIAESSKLAISHLLNYPNPFTDRTQFYFEHNGDGSIEYELRVFTLSGKIVKTITGNMANAKSLSDPIEWDGRDNFGNQIARGVYFYKLKIKNLDNQKASATEKLLYLK